MNDDLSMDPEVHSMPEAITFICPHCHNQLSLPAATVGSRGECPACRKVVLIQPSCAARADAHESQDLVTPPAVGAVTVQSVKRRKRVAFLLAGVLFSVFLVAVVLIGLMGSRRASPESVGRAVFDALQTNDWKAVERLGPTVEVAEAVYDEILSSDLSDDEVLAYAEMNTPRQRENQVAAWRTESRGDFVYLQEDIQWTGAALVTVLRDSSADDRDVNGAKESWRDPPQGSIRRERAFVVFDVKGTLFLLVADVFSVDGSRWILSSFYASSLNSPVRFELEGLGGSDEKSLRTSLRRARSPHRARILQAMEEDVSDPAEDDEYPSPDDWDTNST